MYGHWPAAVLMLLKTCNGSPAAEAKAKDKWERKDFGRPTIMTPSAFSAEPSTGSRVAVSPRRNSATIVTAIGVPIQTRKTQYARAYFTAIVVPA
jgi:hypothetical protein